MPDIKHKIGQMLMLGFKADTPHGLTEEGIIPALNNGTLGGVLLFRHNIKNAQQIKSLNKAILASTSNPIPFIAVDQEGGRVQRLRASNGLTDYMSAYQVAQQQTPEQAHSYYRGLAKELKEAGFNWNYAPVLDIHDPTCPVIGHHERAFSNEMDQIAAYGKASVEAHLKERVLPCAKHWFGHGTSRADSHMGLADITKTWQSEEMSPFTKVQSPAIMTAHLIHQDYDPKYPLTLSEAYIVPWLRQEQGYQGVIITDDLHMGAIQAHYEMEEVIIRAINAGNDILMFSSHAGAAPNHKQFPITPQSFQETVLRGLDTQQLSLQRIEESYARITKLKEMLK